MSNPIKAIFSKIGKDMITEVGSVVDNLTTSDDEKSRHKKELADVVLDNLNDLYETQGSVIKTEMKGNFLQRSWRPILMLTFGVIIVMKWFGYTDTSISDELEIKLLDIIELGLGGYVVGRSVEKVASTVTENIDLPFIKRNQRNK